MAVRGTELRLAIIVSNQASFALSRIGSDLRRLQAQGEVLNRNQIHTLGQLANQREKVARLTQKAAAADRSHAAQVLRNQAGILRTEAAIRKLRGATNAEAIVADRVQATGKARILQLQLQALRQDAKRLGIIEAQNAAIRIQIGEEAALAARIAQVGMAEAARLDAMERRMAQLQQRQVTGRAISHVGRAASFGGLIATASLAGASGAFANFDRQATLAATQTRQAGENFLATARNADILRTEILEMTRSFPAAAGEMADAAYQIFSSTQATFPSGIRLLREFNRAAVAGGVSLEEATSIGIRVLNNFDAKFRQTGQVTDETFKILNRMFSIVRFGAINFSEFGQIMEQVAPASANAGQSIDDVAGAIAFLTRQLGPAKTGAGLARLIEVFQRDEFKRGMKELGADITDATGALLPFEQIMLRIAAVTRDMPEGSNIIKAITAIGEPGTKGLEGTIQARRALNFLLEDMQSFIDLQDLTTANQNEFNQAFEAMSRTPGVRWAVMTNQLRALVLVIGESAIPVIANLIDEVIDLIHWWENLSEGTRNAAVKWGVFLSVGALVGGLILSLIGSLISLSAQLGELAMGLGGPRGVAGQLSGLLVTLRGLAAIGLITIGIKLIQEGGNWERIGWVLAAAGLGAARGGIRGAAVAGSIAIGVQMVLEGEGWTSKIGQILIAGAAGAAFGGAPGAVIATAAAVITVALKDEDAKNDMIALAKEFQRRSEEISQTAATALNISPTQATRNLRSALQGFLRENAIDINSKAGLESVLAFMNAWEQGLRRTTGPRDAFDAMLGGSEKVVDSQKQSVAEMIRQIGAGTEIQTIMEKIAAETGEAATEADRFALNLIKAAKAGNMAEFAKQLQDFARQANAELSPAQIMQQIQEAAKAGNLEEVQRLMDEYANAVKAAADDAAKASEEAADRIVRKNEAIAKSVEDMQGQIDDAGRRLADMYRELESQNRNVFGQLFQGPVMTGPLGEFFDEMRQFNIPPPIKLLTQDLEAQTENFENMQRNIALLRKRGAPPALLDQIRAMGEEGQLFLESLAQAPASQLRGLIAAFTTAERAIETATKIDMQSKLALWEKQGKAMMQALILGVKRESDQLDQFFINYITKKFPNLLKQAAKESGIRFETENPPRRRATGGSVIPGERYTVGEFGPETLIFDKPGRIMPGTRSTAEFTKSETHYHDHTQIIADGASTESVMRALNKRNFRLQNRYRYGR